MGFKNFAELDVNDVVYCYFYRNGAFEEERITINDDNLIVYKNVDVERNHIYDMSGYYDYNWVDNKLEKTEKVGLETPIWFNEKYKILYTTIPNIDNVIKGLFECGKDGLRREVKNLLNIIDTEPYYGDIRFR